MPNAAKSLPINPFLRADVFSTLPWLVHGFSTRLGGVSKAYGANSLNLGFTKHDTRAAVERNREIFLGSLGADGWPLVTLRQIHSDVTHRIEDIPAQPLAGDGLITDRPGILLAVQTADCIPVMVADPDKRAIGVFHAGWRGTLARTVEKGVGLMRAHFASSPRDLVAAIGPGIHACCYEVGAAVRDSFYSQFAYAPDLFSETRESDPVREKYPLLFLTARAPGHSPLPSRITLDLIEANLRQLLAAGVVKEKIWISDLCTACRADLLFSHRAEQGTTGRMMNAVGIRP